MFVACGCLAWLRVLVFDVGCWFLCRFVCYCTLLMIGYLVGGCFEFVCLWLLVLFVLCCVVRLFGVGLCCCLWSGVLLGRWFVLGFGFVGFGL